MSQKKKYVGADLRMVYTRLHIHVHVFTQTSLHTTVIYLYVTFQPHVKYN